MADWRSWRWYYSLLLAWLWVLPASASPSTAPEVEVSTDTPVTLALSENNYPYFYRNSLSGEADGLLIDIWRLWSDATGIPLKFEISDWEGSLEMLKTGAAQLHVGMASTPERTQFARFGPPIHQLSTHLFLHRALEPVETFAELAPYQIGVIDGTRQQRWLREHIPTASLRSYPSRDALYSGVLAGEVLVFAGLERLDDKSPSYDLLESRFPNSRKMAMEPVSFRAAVSRAAPESLLALVEQGMAAIPELALNRVRARWLGLLHGGEELIVGVAEGFKPYSFRNQQGQMDGFIVELWKKWGELQGYRVRFEGFDAQAMLDALKSNRVDLVAGSVMYPGIEQEADSVAHLFDYRSALFYPAARGRIERLEQLPGRRLGIHRLVAYNGDAALRFKQFTLSVYDSTEALMQAMEEGQVDAVLSGAALVAEWLRDNDAVYRYRRLDDETFSGSVYVLANQGSRQLRGIVTRGFSQLSPQQQADIEARWVVTPDDRYFENLPVNAVFNANEQSFLRNVEHLRVGYMRDYQPFETQSAQGKFIGFNADLLDWISEQLDVPFEAVPFNSWNALMEAIQRREIDLVGAIAENPDRESYISFSTPYWKTPWTLASRDMNSIVSGLGQLAGKRVGVTAGYKVIPELQLRYPEVELRQFTSIEAGLRALAAGEVDGYLDTLAALSAKSQLQGYSNLKLMVLNELGENGAHFGIRSDWPELVTVFNKTLSVLNERTRDRMMERWLTLKIEQHTDWSPYLRNGLIAILVLSLLVGYVSFSNARLKREIAARKRAELQISHLATHDDLTGLPNRRLLQKRFEQLLALHHRTEQQIGVLFIDLNGFKQVNDSVGHAVGDLVLREAAKRLQNLVRASDMVIRFGGDEFVLLASNLVHRAQASDLADKIQRLLAEPFVYDQQQFSLSASIGIAMAPEEGQVLDVLVGMADQRMYKAKLCRHDRLAHAAAVSVGLKPA